ncbi:MAG: hypothetical protein QNJ42_15950 [Crocosphaera sp.]|nr:hypothetical protein [Crocosphaera sp.]
MNLPTQQSQSEPIVVEGDENEVIPPEDIAESEAAWQDYLAGKDQGMSLEELEQELWGNNLE